MLRPAPGAFISRPTYEVTAGTLRSDITLRGELDAAQQASLVFPVSGIVKEVDVTPGEQVEAGATLAVLNAPAQELDLMQRESDLTIARLQLQRLQAQTPTTSTLSETSPAYIDLEIAQQRVTLAESLYAFSQAQYDRTLLTAPFAGTISSFSKQQGSQVTPYETVGCWRI